MTERFSRQARAIELMELTTIMENCCTCRFARLDYYEYYGTTDKNWFVDGCKKNLDPEYCEEYEEYEEAID